VVLLAKSAGGKIDSDTGRIEEKSRYINISAMGKYLVSYFRTTQFGLYELGYMFIVVSFRSDIYFYVYSIMSVDTVSITLRNTPPF
jgi:hypothetical protein